MFAWVGQGLTGCACVRRVQDGKDESKGNEVKIGEARAPSGGAVIYS